MTRDNEIIVITKAIEKSTNFIIKLFEKELLSDADIDKLLYNLEKREKNMKLIDSLEFVKTEEMDVWYEDIMSKDKKIKVCIENYMVFLKGKIEQTEGERNLKLKQKLSNKSYLRTEKQNDGYFIDYKK